MGKPAGKKKNQAGQKSGNATGKAVKPSDRSSKAFDEDTAVFITMSQELKEEGNKLIQKRDYEGAMLKFEKALKLLPRNHIDLAYLRTNMASCYMQLGLGEYPRAIAECNLALEVSPKYSKALLKRARCYEGLNRLDLAYRDVLTVLHVEPNNSSALEIAERLRKVMGDKGIHVDEKEIVLDSVESQGVVSLSKDSDKKKRNDKQDGEKVEGEVVTEKMSVAKDKEQLAEKVAEEKLVEGEKVVIKTMKLVLGEDIRFAQLPADCSIGLVREVARDRFPNLKGILVKYKDQEGDLVTITTTHELRLAEESCPQASSRLYIVEVSPDQEPAYGEISNEVEMHMADTEPVDGIENVIARYDKEAEKGSCSIDDWLVQFARLFKNHVGFDSDSYLDLHEVGMRLYSEAMEDTVTGENAQELFEIAAEKFQEMAALALFNWGNVHMSRARKQVLLSEDVPRESVLVQVKSAYDWAQKEYGMAERKYEESTKIKPDFYEGMLALGQQQFEQAKLCWYYAISYNIDIESASVEVLQLYNKAEDSMDRGMQIWEEMEEQQLNGISKLQHNKSKVDKMGLEGIFEEISTEEAAEQGTNMRSQIYLLWGSLLYERSIVEYKLELPTWEECLEVSVEKFELAGASPTDIAVMIKNHCSNGSALEGFGFKIDEIVQAWNEMYDAKRWQIGVPSFRLEPLFRRRVPKLHYILEHF